MKIATLFIIFLSFSTISLDICSAVTRSHRYRRVKRTRAGRTKVIAIPNNKWAHFFYNVFLGWTDLSETEVTNLNNCLPAAWKLEERKETVPAADVEPEGNKSLWTEILDGVGKVIEFFCKFKDQIKSLFTRRIRRQMRRGRLFLQSSLARYRRTAGFWSSIWDNCKRAVASVVQGVKGVISFAQTVWNEAKNFANTIISNLSMLWDNFKGRLRRLFPTVAEFVDRVSAWVECMKRAKDAFTKIKNAIVAIVDTVKTFIRIFAGDMVALASYFINLLCNFSVLREAFSSLFDAIKENDQFKRYDLFGKFAGLLARGLTAGRRHKL